MRKIILMAVTALAIAGFYIYKDLCKSSPECSCKNTAPGDPTCMSAEQLSKWCDEQSHAKDLPQCQK